MRGDKVKRHQIDIRRCTITDKAIAKAVGIGQVTFSRWKQSRPKLYQRIKQSFECEETMRRLGVSLEEALKIIEAYKAKEKGDT